MKSKWPSTIIEFPNFWTLFQKYFFSVEIFQKCLHSPKTISPYFNLHYKIIIDSSCTNSCLTKIFGSGSRLSIRDRDHIPAVTFLPERHCCRVVDSAHKSTACYVNMGLQHLRIEFNLLVVISNKMDFWVPKEARYVAVAEITHSVGLRVLISFEKFRKNVEELPHARFRDLQCLQERFTV